MATSLQPFQRYDWDHKILNGSCDPDHFPDHAHFKGDLSPVFWDLT